MANNNEIDPLLTLELSGVKTYDRKAGQDVRCLSSSGYIKDG